MALLSVYVNVRGVLGIEAAAAEREAALVAKRERLAKRREW